MANERIPCAVLGCTGIVGQQFVRLLAGHPDFEIACLAASTRSAGQGYQQAVRGQLEEDVLRAIPPLTIVPATCEAVVASGSRAAFVALPAAVAADLEEEMRRFGIAVFSNASGHRLDEDVPLVIPEVNPGHLELVKQQAAGRGGFIVTNSNCTASGLALALKPLLRFGLEAAEITSFQAVSGAGRRGVPGYDILGNVVPFIPQEEEKVERETARMLGILNRGRVEPHAAAIHASCTRVAVKDGHLESVILDLAEEPSVAEVGDALASFRALPQELGLPTAPLQPLIVRSEPVRPQPLLDCMAGEPERSRGMAVSIGRIRKKGRRYGFFLLVHNLIRGAAGSSVLNAELCLRLGYCG